MRKSKIYELDDEQFTNLIKNSNTFTDVLKWFGLSTSGGSSRDTIKQRIQELHINTDHFVHHTVIKESYQIYTLDEILVKNSTYANIQCLKRRLIEEKRLEYTCEKCGNKGEWNGESLSLHLDHKNGISNDHRLENLRFLCPNCHSQTDTYAGKNNKK